MGPHAPARAGRHGDMVLEPAAKSLAPSSGWTASGQHVHDLAHAARSWVELAEEPHLVRNRCGDAPAQARCGARQRSRGDGQKKLIEQAYTLGAQLGLSVWCEDEAGPFQAVPHPGASWQPQGKPATQPHEYIRGGTAKLLTLFRPATGEVRGKGVTNAPNTVLHPWLREEFAQVLAALPPVTTPESQRPAAARWATWLGHEPREPLPPLRLLLIWDNLAGHLSWPIVRWLFQHGVMPLYTPLSGSWLNLAESIQRILVRRALEGHHPQSQEELISWLDDTVAGWNATPTPFVWHGKRFERRQRARQRRLGGSPASQAQSQPIAA